SLQSLRRRGVRVGALLIRHLILHRSRFRSRRADGRGSRGRRWRTAHGRRLLDDALDLLLDARGCTLELADGTSDSTRELRELLPAEQHQRADEDQQEIGPADATT